jgi:hypothetical protein
MTLGSSPVQRVGTVNVAALKCSPGRGIHSTIVAMMAPMQNSTTTTSPTQIVHFSFGIGLKIRRYKDSSETLIRVLLRREKMVSMIEG